MFAHNGYWLHPAQLSTFFSTRQNFSDRKGKTESLGERKAEHSEGANQRKTNIKQTLPEKNAKFVGLHIIIAFET
ncbi:hypothetical protein PGIN_13-1_00629 [Porphyromonas gingivalis]|nr:hypothetical protein PGIN_13-1_00629 [Porphyromonas gingivalis]